uniref:WGS project CBMI000000000 data, contig CS3069_c001729 n=1 Tax=Fusarium clavum TaxID=2594811 RepID=A0A090MG60_9HYPO|nr:unnamed protein product [Fusarium clavum]CEG05806.1 unnamed protein product [Fusarium clavum]
MRIMGSLRLINKSLPPTRLHPLVFIQTTVLLLPKHGRCLDNEKATRNPRNRYISSTYRNRSHHTRAQKPVRRAEFCNYSSSCADNISILSQLVALLDGP